TSASTMAVKVPSSPRNPSGPEGASRERKATPTTTVGSTNGTVTMARSTPRPRKERQYNTYAPGTPSSTDPAVPSTAWAKVSPMMRHVREEEKTSLTPARSRAPSATNPRTTSAATG